MDYFNGARSIIDRATKIFDTGGGVFKVPWFATTFALMGRIEGKSYKTFLRQLFRVYRTDLFLHTASGVARTIAGYYRLPSNPGGRCTLPATSIFPFLNEMRFMSNYPLELEFPVLGTSDLHHDPTYRLCRLGVLMRRGCILE
ncbi:hypothetical protein ACVIDN_006741 [Rhizobium brockwellii]